jgi:hypothetical protein
LFSGHVGKQRREPHLWSKAMSDPLMTGTYKTLPEQKEVLSPTVVYGSGIIPITKMVRSGIVFDIAGLVLTVLLIPLMAAVVGLV